MSRDANNSNSKSTHTDSGQRATMRVEATSGSHRKEFEALAARRFQDPTPEKSGAWWYIRVRQDVFENNILTRKLKRIKIAPAEMPARQVQRLAVEFLRPMNQGLISAGGQSPSANSWTTSTSRIRFPCSESLRVIVTSRSSRTIFCQLSAERCSAS